MYENEWNEREDDQLTKMLKIMSKVSSMNVPYGASGKTECPCCHGAEALVYARAPHNGHIRAICRTCDVNVMQ